MPESLLGGAIFALGFNPFYLSVFIQNPFHATLKNTTNAQTMTKSHLLPLMALTLILTGCGTTSDSDDPNVFTHEYELCLENGEMVEYIVERCPEVHYHGPKTAHLPLVWLLT